MPILIALLCATVSFSLHAQARPAWLDHSAITAEVLNLEGYTVGESVRIRRGDQIKVRVIQGPGRKLIERANQLATQAPHRETPDAAGSQEELKVWAEVDALRNEAEDYLYDYIWIAGTNESLAYIKSTLKPKTHKSPKHGLRHTTVYRVPKAILLELNGTSVSTSECPTLLGDN